MLLENRELVLEPGLEKRRLDLALVRPTSSAVLEQQVQ
jgi:hypothetical protein